MQDLEPLRAEDDIWLDDVSNRVRLKFKNES